MTRAQLSLEALISMAALTMLIAVLLSGVNQLAAGAKDAAAASHTHAEAYAIALEMNLRAGDSGFSSTGEMLLPDECSIAAKPGFVACVNGSAIAYAPLYGGAGCNYAGYNRIPI